jgi:beta-lactamase regulating signal transducer with metallopeptidase domain
MNIIDPAAIDLAALVHTLAWTLLHFLWQGCALAAAFALTLLALRRARPAVRYLAGCVTLMMMAATPIATFAWLWSQAIDTTTLRVVTLNAEQSGGLIAVPAHAQIDQKLFALVLMWGIGVAACTIWVAGGWLQTLRLRRIDAIEPSPRLRSAIGSLSRTLGVSAAVRIVDHAAIAVPMTLGVLKPIILIPAAMLTSLSPAHLEAIIAHEMAHVRRLDFLVNLLQAVLEAMLFYHPAVWWVSRQVRQEREFCCDDVAAAVCGNRVTYARALTELEALRSASISGSGARLGLSSQGGSLMKRIIRLVGEGNDRPRGVPGDRRSRLSASAALASMLAAASAAFALAQSPRAAVTPPADQALQVEGHLQQADHAYAAAVHAYFGRLHEAAQGETAWLETEDGAFALEFAGEPGQGVWMLEGHVQAELAAAADAQIAADLGGDIAQLRVAAVRTAVQSRLGCVFDAHGQPVLLSRAATATIDPEKMPSEGLIRAAQYVYPFDLFSLTPWVDPNAQQVLIVPQVQPFLAQPAEVADGELMMRLGYYIHAQGALEVQPQIDLRLNRAAQELSIELAPMVGETEVTDAEAEAQVDGEARANAVANVLLQLVGETPSATEAAEQPAAGPPAETPASQPPATPAPPVPPAPPAPPAPKP